jgi:hypothetical protein
LEVSAFEDDSDDCEPLATEQEAAEYEEQVAREEEEEVRLQARFSCESDTNTWYVLFFYDNLFRINIHCDFNSLNTDQNRFFFLFMLGVVVLTALWNSS